MDDSKKDIIVAATTTPTKEYHESCDESKIRNPVYSRMRNNANDRKLISLSY